MWYRNLDNVAAPVKRRVKEACPGKHGIRDSEQVRSNVLTDLNNTEALSEDVMIVCVDGTGTQRPGPSNNMHRVAVTLLQ